MLLLANEDTKINIVDSSFKFLNAPDYNTMLDTVETAYRNCYKSENNKDTVETFIKTKLNAGHERPIEHCVISVIMTVDRGVSHEIVRHRPASFGQESTRYCNYSLDKFGKEITIVNCNGTRTALSAKGILASPLPTTAAEALVECIIAWHFFFCSFVIN